MNVLLASPWDLEEPGGVSVVVRTLGTHWARAGDHVVYLLPTHDRAVQEDVRDGLRFYRVPMRRPVIETHLLRSRLAFLLFFPLTCWRLARILHRERIEVVNAHYFLDSWVYFSFLRRLMFFKLVFSVHGSDVLGPEGPRNLRLLGRWRACFDRIVFCSEAFRRKIISLDSRLDERSAVVLNGLDYDALPTATTKNLPRGYVVCVAHLREVKAQDILLRAFRLLSEHFPALELDLVGEGPDRGYLEDLAGRLGLAKKVNFRGDLPREKALELIREARVLCLPSRHESFGLVLLEAMALKTPVVATTTGGIPEIIRDGVDGLLVPPDRPDELAGALHKVLTDEQLRARLVASAEKRAREAFTAGRFAMDYRNLMLRLLQPQPQ